MECHVCGQEMKKTSWMDEYWGSMKRIDDYECMNPTCGIEEEEEDE